VKKSIPDDCMPRCKGCSFYDAEPKDEIGYCRRFPPTAIQINDEVEMVIPVFGPTDWCGEFRRAVC